MSDIFDDVEKMLAEENSAASSSVGDASSSAETIVDEAAIFNESELEDIMAEIESLEGDFEATAEGDISIDELSIIPDEALISEEAPVSALIPEVLKCDSSKKEKSDLQKAIDDELSIEVAAPADISEAPVVAEASCSDEAVVLPFEKVSTPVVETLSSTARNEMSFQASGLMNVSLTFKVGLEEAKLYIDDKKGLVISMGGVEVTLNEETGCKVIMSNGAQVTIPLTSEVSVFKKAQ